MMKKNKYVEIGLGIFLAGVRFRVKMERYKYGFGIRARHMIDLTLNASQKMFVEIWLDSIGMKYQATYSKKNDIQKILGAIENYKEALTDKKGLRKVLWLIDNPIPYTGVADANDFESWVTAWDAENEGL
tara:strand:+ start:539 stop:928 length:390 start_codon:yes stop_codon:yes gene_type:complete